MRVAEAALLLLWARFLIAFVPFGWWRGRLGRVCDAVEVSAAQIDAKRQQRADRVAGAVRRACHHLPFSFVCLPRAMAVQWMLARRGVPSTLVFGAAPATDAGAPARLHAWVEVGGAVIVGAREARSYRPGLRLVRP